MLQTWSASSPTIERVNIDAESRDPSAKSYLVGERHVSEVALVKFVVTPRKV